MDNSALQVVRRITEAAAGGIRRIYADADKALAMQGALQVLFEGADAAGVRAELQDFFGCGAVAVCVYLDCDQDDVRWRRALEEFAGATGWAIGERRETARRQNAVGPVVFAQQLSHQQHTINLMVLYGADHYDFA